jgi:hypothetical protein
VVRVVFTFTPRLLIVTKVGLLRASRMEFEMEKCGFHVFRTHVSEERCVFLGVLGGFLRVFGGFGSAKMAVLRRFLTGNRCF